MQEVLAITLQSMHQDMVRLERVGNNLANAMTPGYKREVVAVQASGSSLSSVGSFDAMLQSSATDTANAAAPTAAQALSVRSDLRPGTLRATGQSLDLALDGPGYFEVQTPEGLAYTRMGSFQLDDRGRLVTAQGHAVMGTGGEILLPNGSPSIDAQGQVFDRSVPGVTDNLPLGQIKRVGFDNPQQLLRQGNGLMIDQGAKLAAETPTAQIRQGYQEASNVSSMHEMVELMQTMRHFESMQKVALGYDEMIGSAVRKLGDMS